MLKIEDTPWALKFKADCPSQYDDAIIFAKSGRCMELLHTNEFESKWLWAVVVNGTEFWMYALEDKSEAIDLCRTMGWGFIDQSRQG